MEQHGVLRSERKHTNTLHRCSQRQLITFMVWGARMLQQRGRQQNPKHTYPRQKFIPNSFPNCPGNSRCWKNGCLSRPFTGQIGINSRLKFQTFLLYCRTKTTTETCAAPGTQAAPVAGNWLSLQGENVQGGVGLSLQLRLLHFSSTLPASLSSLFHQNALFTSHVMGGGLSWPLSIVLFSFRF